MATRQKLGIFVRRRAVPPTAPLGDNGRRYNRSMTSAPTPIITATNDLPGLTDDDTARVAAALNAARTESTQTVYAHAWRQ